MQKHTQPYSTYTCERHMLHMFFFCPKLTCSFHPAKACKVGYKLGHRVMFLFQNFEYFIKNKNIKPLLQWCNTLSTAVSSGLIGQVA